MTVRYLTTLEVAEIIRESPENVRRRCASGQIAAKKLGQDWRIAEDAVVEFMTPSVSRSPRRRLTARQRRLLAERKSA